MLARRIVFAATYSLRIAHAVFARLSRFRDIVYLIQRSLPPKLGESGVELIVYVGRSAVPNCAADFTIVPLDLKIAVAVLTTGQFIPTYTLPDEDAIPLIWQRDIPEEATAVAATFDGLSLSLSLLPAVSDYAGHAGKRIAASVYFEIAAKYAEKVGGTIVQHSNVGACKGVYGTTTEHLLADYPFMPLGYERVCPGFRSELLGGAAE